jgi:hypothetical protein
LKHCPKCTSQVAEASTTCAVCGAQVTDSTAASVAAARAHAPERSAHATVHPATAPVNTAAGRRELLLFAAAVTAGGILTFALLFTRGGSSSNLSAAAVDGASRPPASSAKPSTPAAAVQTWSVENRGHWLGSTRHGAAFELPAENVVQTWFGPMRPALIVRCTSRTIQTFVFTGSAMKIEPRTDGKTVTVSVDYEPVKTERWTDSDDHDALFETYGAAFKQRLMHERTLRFG